MTIKKIFSVAELIKSRSKPHRAGPDDLFSTLFSSPRGKDERRYECIWYQDAEADFDLPNVINVDRDLDRLFADIATFYPDYAPITGYVHVIGKKLESRPEEPIFGFSSPRAVEEKRRRAWVGLNLAEGLSNAYIAGGQEEDATYSLCRRGVSYAIARAYSLYPNWPMDDVVSRWIRVRELSKMETSEAITASVLWVSRLIAGQNQRSAPPGTTESFGGSLQQLYDGAISVSEFLDLLSKVYPGTSEHLSGLTGDFDGRIPALERIIESIRGSSNGKDFDALAIAFFTNCILPGSFAYTKFLGRFVGVYPSILIWYGFVTATADEFDWRGVFSGMGLKIWRDISNKYDLHARPSSDIAIEELIVLTRIGLKSRTLKPAHQKAIVVSLLPGVDLLTRLPSEDESQATQPGIPGFHEESLLAEVAARDQKLLALLQKAQELIGATSDRASVDRKVKKARTGNKRSTNEF